MTLGGVERPDRVASHVDTAPDRKRIVVISYSQSGQLRRALDALLHPLDRTSIDVVHETLRPVEPFPFPWPAHRFLDVFPESFQGVPCALEPVSVDPDEHFDLVILAYQVWYLSPSRPVAAFLQSADGKRLLRGKRVVTVVGARNMWYRAHEQVKAHLREAGADLIGHIALTDPALNLVSVVTTVHWMLSGEKRRVLGVLPRPGIPERDLQRCPVFGRVIAEALTGSPPTSLQRRLNEQGACRTVAHLIALEDAASRVFSVWSRVIRKARSPRRRRFLVKAFGLYLVCAITLATPVAFVLFYATLPFRRASAQRRADRVYQY